MSALMDDIDFTNWSKGTIALQITRSGVTKFVERKWKEEIRSWPEEERNHLPVFLKDMHENKIKITLHKRNKKNKPDKKQEVKKMNAYEAKAECKHYLCLKLVERIIPENPKNIVLQCDSKPEKYPNGEERYWELAKLYMHGYTDEDTKTHGSTDENVNTHPGNTEPSLVFKMMKNCYVFVDDDEIYDDVLKVRNSLMHSPTTKLTFDELNRCMTVLKKFLTGVHENECEICEPNDTKETCDLQQKIKTAKEELDKLLAKKTAFERTKEDLKMMETALEEQRKVLESEKRQSGMSGISSSTLDLILEANQKRTNEYTVFIKKYETIYRYDTPADRQNAYQKLVEEDQRKERERIETEEKQRLNNEERKIKDEVDKRLREIREEEKRKKQEEDKKREEEEREKREEERRKREEEDRKRREAEERKKQEEEKRKREEEERKKQEEEKRKREEEERKKREEEKRKKEDEERQRQLEATRQREEYERKTKEELEEEEKKKQRAIGVLVTAGGASAGGVAAAAMMGAPLGPLGMAVGGTVGLLGALFGGGKKKDNDSD